MLNVWIPAGLLAGTTLVMGITCVAAWRTRRDRRRAEYAAWNAKLDRSHAEKARDKADAAAAAAWQAAAEAKEMAYVMSTMPSIGSQPSTIDGEPADVLPFPGPPVHGHDYGEPVA